MKRMKKLIIILICCSSCVTANVGKNSKGAQLRKIKQQQYRSENIDQYYKDKKKFETHMFWYSVAFTTSMVISFRN